MQLISEVTVGSGGAASITFSAIPADYTDLLILYTARDSIAGGTSYLTIAFNGSTSNFSIRGLGGGGTSSYSFTTPSNFVGEAVGNIATSNTFANGSIYIPNYRSSVAKSFSADSVGENNATAAQQAITAGLWNNTAAITSVTLAPLTSPLIEGSSASLFGITAGSDGITAVS